jgi:hypothetical protein
MAPDASKLLRALGEMDAPSATGGATTVLIDQHETGGLQGAPAAVIDLRPCGAALVTCGTAQFAEVTRQRVR